MGPTSLSWSGGSSAFVTDHFRQMKTIECGKNGRTRSGGQAVRAPLGRTRPSATHPPVVSDGLGSPGDVLGSALRVVLEPRLGHESAARVHRLAEQVVPPAGQMNLL